MMTVGEKIYVGFIALLIVGLGFAIAYHFTVISGVDHQYSYAVGYDEGRRGTTAADCQHSYDNHLYLLHGSDLEEDSWLEGCLAGVRDTE